LKYFLFFDERLDNQKEKKIYFD